jgi:hypothetical protein
MLFGDANQTGSLHAWLYDVDQDGKSRSMMPGNQPLVTPPGATLRVNAAGGLPEGAACGGDGEGARHGRP